MEWEHVRWDERKIVLPAALLKGRKVLVLPLPEIVIEHWLPIRRNEGCILNWPGSREYFRQAFHRMQDRAGIPPEQHFGLHSLRRTGITKMWAKSPAAAQLLAGHGSPIITQMSYVNCEEVLTDAMATAAAAPFTGGKACAT